MSNVKNAKFAYVQSGYCVFGLGTTENAAIIDAGRSLDPTVIENEDGSISIISGRENAEFHLERSRGFDGDMKIISKSENREEFLSYIKSI